MIKIEKVLNNNAVVAINDDFEELVVMGKGLAFKKKVGDVVDQTLIERHFVLKENDTKEKLAQLLTDTAFVYLDLATEIVNYAKLHLTYELNEYIYIALTDHLSFAITRAKEGIHLKNGLLYEVRKYYRAEFAIARHCLEIIENRTGFYLTEDEAGSIALHLVNSQINGENMQDTIHLTEMVTEITNLVNNFYQIEMDQTSVNYDRFVTHLRFFFVRILRQETLPETNDPFLFSQIKTTYKDALRCAKVIAKYVKQTCAVRLSNDELVFLTLHIARVKRG